MKKREAANSSRRSGTRLALLAAAACWLGGCTGDDGDTGPQGPPGDGGTDSALAQGDDVPGIVLAITGVSGGTGPGGRFRPGDRLSVNFTVEKGDGSAWELDEFSSGRTLVSGPTFNYQRVFAEVNDVVASAVAQADGSFTYTYATPIPATYIAPLNDTPTFGPEDGELTGQALLEGTYTLGLYLVWNFTVDGDSKRDAANATVDFVIGTVATVEPRQVVLEENCNRCHDGLRLHGGSRQDVTLCLLCHNSGAEDRNTLAGGTPGVSIDFKVMIHKIHTGEHLPSVQGVATNPDGSRDYAATPQPYQVVAGSIHDYSDVAFPAWPHGLIATPRDEGYSALSADDKTKEDLIRTGPSNCAVCHGDPDGTGPLVEPAQGDVHRTQPSRQACGSCHDDVHWGQPYTANLQTMPAQANNANCTLCHEASGNSLAVLEAHLHPLKDPTFDSGTNLDVTALVEAGTNDDDGTLDPGEKIAVTFALLDDSGAEILPASASNLSMVVSGPTDNYNLLLNATLPVAKLTGAQPFTTNVPMPIQLERIGVATGGADVFTSAFAPIWDLSGAATTVFVRTATAGGDSVLAAASSAPQNHVDVLDATSFARDDYVVVDDGTGSEEYARIQLVEDERLWFSSPYSAGYPAGFVLAHAAGATVREVTLTAKASPADYTVDGPNATITEASDFGDGNVVLASYTTDFVLPATYPLALNDGPDLGEESGEWAGKPLVDGTYTLGIWTARSLTLNLLGETNGYRSTAEAESVDFLVGSADAVEPYALISSGTNCFNCHQELAFHGFGRRGFESCVLCHGSAGAEDRPQYVAANAPATDGLTISFRTMLHKIHMGKELANASSYLVNGFGSGSYPNNYTAHSYGEVGFPAMPGGVQNCDKCHGDTNEAWHEPAARAHPTDQGAPIQRWAMVCGACHDSTDSIAHIEVQTSSSGAESCGVCHGESGEWSVERVHKPY